jgi:hypothetical protein
MTGKMALAHIHTPFVYVCTVVFPILLLLGVRTSPTDTQFCLECDAGIGGGPAAGAAGLQGEGADPGAHHQHPLHQHHHQRHRLQRLLILIQVREYPPFLLEFLLPVLLQELHLCILTTNLILVGNSVNFRFKRDEI